MVVSASVLSCLRETVRLFPGRPAVSDAERTLTYRELWQEAEAYASRLGEEKGKANLVEAWASADFAVAVIGTYLAGTVFVPYARNAPTEVVRRIREEVAVGCAREDTNTAEVAEILYTTGTTGASKGVVLSHSAVWSAADYHCETDRSDETSVCLIASPLNHISALGKMLSCFLVGAHAVLLDGFVDLKRYYAMVLRHRVNVLLLPPAAVQMMFAVSRDRLCAFADQIREVYSSGSPMCEAARESLCCCLPKARLIFAYGATETSGSCCAYDYAEFPGKPNCIGKPSPHAKITIENGCIVVSGNGLMEGYLNDPALTAQVLRDGKLYTNDLGRIDDEGFVYVTGRKDDIINCGGMKIAPIEVEEVAMRYPDVRECVCFDIPDRLAGSAVKLMVVPKSAQGFDLRDFRRFLQERLEPHQVPTQIVCVAEIPKTPNGKMDRRCLRIMEQRREDDHE